MKLERITNVRLPFDMRSSNPHKNYGIHGLDIWFILKGEKGAVQFAFMIPYYLPHIGHKYTRDDGFPSGVDVGYHALTPQYEGQEPMDCQLFGKCYYDGSGLRADDWVREVFSIKGERLDERIWNKLEEEYKGMFEHESS